MNIVVNNIEYLDFFKNIKSYFFAGNSIHKARNEIKVISYKNETLVVKSFKVPHVLNKLIYTYFKKSKAEKSYENSIIIKEFVPEPIGFVEFRSFGLLCESYFVSKEFLYDFTIREPLLDVNFQNRNDIFLGFARFTCDLHNAGIFHDDYSPGNILIKKYNSGYVFKIVDINRMRFYNQSSMPEKCRANNFSKLWASDKDLRILAEEYIRYCNCSDNFVDLVLYYSNQNKKIKNFKKRLKGQKIVD